MTRSTRIALATAMLLLAGCGSESASLVGYEVEPVPQVGHLTATDASAGGTEFPLRAESGRLLVMFLGFTNCPDACPTALTDVRIALERLGPDATRIDVAMLTVDPTRDTPTVLTDYVRGFVDRAHALRVEDPTRLRAISDAFGANFETQHDHDGRTVDVGHTDYTYLIDDTGAVILTWTNEMTVDDIVNDLRIVTEEI